VFGSLNLVGQREVRRHGQGRLYLAEGSDERLLTERDTIRLLSTRCDLRPHKINHRPAARCDDGLGR
jgi:hypothetical protein